jgi:preprotein translocase subunit SecE
MTLIDKNKQIKISKDVVEDRNMFSPSEVKKFVQEVKIEASKIVWPEKKVTISLTLVVITLSAMVSLYLGTIDLLLGKLIASILN